MVSYADYLRLIGKSAVEEANDIVHVVKSGNDTNGNIDQLLGMIRKTWVEYYVFTKQMIPHLFPDKEKKEELERLTEERIKSMNTLSGENVIEFIESEFKKSLKEAE